MQTGNITLNLNHMTNAQAYALAELCKRITWSDCRSNSVSDDEAYLMIAATDRVREALAAVGYEVR